MDMLIYYVLIFQLFSFKTVIETSLEKKVAKMNIFKCVLMSKPVRTTRYVRLIIILNKSNGIYFEYIRRILIKKISIYL